MRHIARVGVIFSLWLLAACHSLQLPEGLGGATPPLYQTQLKSENGIEARLVVQRGAQSSSVCALDVDFTNHTREDSQAVTLVLYAYDAHGTLLRVEQVRSSSIRPGGHNHVKVQDTGLCTLEDEQLVHFSTELQ